MLLGEEMPDKDAPKYKARFEKEVEAGRKFARATRIDRFAAWGQGLANRNKTMFLVVVFGFVACCFGLNIYRMARYYNAQPSSQSAIERQEERLKVVHSSKLKIQSDTAKITPNSELRTPNPKQQTDEDNRQN